LDTRSGVAVAANLSNPAAGLMVVTVDIGERRDPPASRKPRDGRFRLEVQPMDDPCLWRWDIYDPSSGRLVESSWSSEWAAYGSVEEAYAAGRERLRTLEAGRKTSPPPGRRAVRRALPPCTSME
jgi:hypothetical protein